MTLKSIRVSAVLVFSFILVSCGSQKPLVSDISVVPEYVGNDVYVSMSAVLAIGNVTLPNAAFPIILPKTGQEIGVVQMQTGLDGKNILGVDINLSSIVNLQADSARLPNGTFLPLIGENQTIEIPIQNKLSLYVSFGNGQAAIGIAVPFRTLDSLGRKVGTTSLFPSFNIKNIIGAAGIYTSRTAGKNGIGLFADITNVMAPVMFKDLGVADKLNLDYSSIIPSSYKERKINKEMLKLHSRRKRLSIN